MKLFADHLPLFYRCPTLMKWDNVKRCPVSLHDLLKFRLIVSDGEEVLRAKEVHCIWNLFINKGSKEYQRLRDMGFVCISSPRKLLLQHLVNYNAIVIHSRHHVELYRQIGWLLALCEFDERKAHSVLLLSTGRRLLLFGL